MKNYKENVKYWSKVFLGISCVCMTTFGGLLLDGGSEEEERFYQAAMISSAVMIHLFASQLFGRNLSD